MKRTHVWIAVLALLFPAVSAAQEKTEDSKVEAPAPAPGTTPLRVQVVFSKFQGEKKVASLPYTLVCNADDRRAPSRLRMGIEVPVPVVVGKDQDPKSFQYKSVGTNIDCSARSLGDGRYKLEISIEQSSIYTGAGGARGAPAGTPSEGRPSWALGETSLGVAPLFRTFVTSFSPILRDGQSAQYTVATDPVSGEVVKVDVSVSVVK